jgi:hypothetical protein
MVMAELGNLMAGILLSLRRMSTVKIRNGSLFCTSADRNGSAGAALARFSEALHRTGGSFTGCTQLNPGSGLRETGVSVQSRDSILCMKDFPK